MKSAEKCRGVNSGSDKSKSLPKAINVKDCEQSLKGIKQRLSEKRRSFRLITLDKKIQLRIPRLHI